MATELFLANSWIWLVTKPNGTGVTLLSKLVSDASIDYVLNAPVQATGTVPSDTPQVNIPYTDGDPFLSYNDRLLYGLRRDGNLSLGIHPYTCRFAGVIQILEDEALQDEPVTHFTAYDPWMWLNSIPVVTPAGDLLGKNGYSYIGKTGDYIVKDVLANALAVVVAQNPSNPLYIDVASGHYDTTDVIPRFDIQQMATVGDVWTQIVNGGYLDIVLTPIYDPSTRPGKLAVLNVYRTAGSAKNNAIFAWDKMPHSLTGFDRLLDGTQLVNVAQYYANALPATQATDAASVGRYGQYWEQKNYPPPSSKDAVGAIALAEVALRKKGKMTLTVDPDPDRAPDPFTTYYLGDRVPVYAGRVQAGGGYSIRQQLTPGDVVDGAWTNPQRIYGFNVTLDNDQVETVTQLLLTDDNPTVS